MARSTNKRILKPHIILCEGRDAEEFLIAFLNNVKSDKAAFLSNDIQVFDFGGNENLYNFMETIKKMDGYDDVRSVLVVRDAETDPVRAQGEVCAALKKAGLPVPETPYTWRRDDISVGYLLFPTCDDAPTEGALEDLCLGILSEEDHEEILDEIDGFVLSLKEDHGRSFPRESKTRLHTYFSVTDSYVSLKIGEAARAGAFDWDSEKLVPMRLFIEAAGDR